MANEQRSHSTANLRSMGSVLSGRYVIDRVLDQRTLTTAYRAYDLAESRFVVLETLDETLVHDPAVLPRLQEEALRTVKLLHRHIVPFYGLEREGHLVFSVREYVDGTVLAAYLARLSRPAMFYEAMQIVDQVGAALHHAHQRGLAHQSVNPQSIVLRYDGRVMLLGFGLPSLAGISCETDLDPLYLSPEQCAGQKADFHVDIYSLAVVAYTICVGRPPFIGNLAGGVDGSVWEAIYQEHVREVPPFAAKLNPDLPAEVSWVLSRALAKRPAERFRSAAEFVAVLKRAWQEAGLDPEAMCVEPPPWIRKPEILPPVKPRQTEQVAPLPQAAMEPKLKVPIYWLVGLFLVVAAVWGVLLTFLLDTNDQNPSRLVLGKEGAAPVLSSEYYAVPTWTPPLIPTPTGTRMSLDVGQVVTPPPTVPVAAGILFNGLRPLTDQFDWAGYINGVRWRSYTDPRFGFALTYPEGWSLEAGNNVLRVYMAERDVGVVVCSCGTRVADAGQWAARVQDMLGAEFPGIEQVEQRIYKAGWLATLARVPQDDEDIQMVILSFGQGERGYAVVFVAWASDWQGARPIFDDMAQNMRFP